MWANHVDQRFGVAGERRRRILLYRMKQKAAGRVCRAAHGSTVPGMGVVVAIVASPCAGVLNLGC
jgi:hypothetical protein